MKKPSLSGPWVRLISYPDHHLNDFCLFQDKEGLWHALGIMGEGTWESEQSFFHATGHHLLAPFQRQPPVLMVRPTGNVSPQKHAPFVVYYKNHYYLFYRRPPGTILRTVSKTPWSWPEPGEVVFEEVDARDVCITQPMDMFFLYYCQAVIVARKSHSGILLRRSTNLIDWSEPSVVHLDTAEVASHSYLESPSVLAGPDGYYLFVRHRLLDRQPATVVLFSEKPDSFPCGRQAWFHLLPDVHAPETVTWQGKHFLARVSGPVHANPRAPARGGWVEIAPLSFL
ncbi:MAG TPA: hypothetical protein PKX93_02435 [bacterium]|nr:hypothetical protein [bacterium]HOL66298.1 hypothetical protein [bacterium]